MYTKQVAPKNGLQPQLIRYIASVNTDAPNESLTFIVNALRALNFLTGQIFGDVRRSAEKLHTEQQPSVRVGDGRVPRSGSVAQTRRGPEGEGDHADATRALRTNELLQPARRRLEGTHHDRERHLPGDAEEGDSVLLETEWSALHQGGMVYTKVSVCFVIKFTALFAKPKDEPFHDFDWHNSCGMKKNPLAHEWEWLNGLQRPFLLCYFVNNTVIIVAWLCHAELNPIWHFSQHVVRINTVNGNIF